MPVILKPEDEDIWLMENDETLLKSLLKPFSEVNMEAYAISKKVNSPINNDSEIIIPEVDGQRSLF